MWNDWKVYERGGAVFSALEPHMEGFFGAPKAGKEYYHVKRALIGWKGQHLYWCYGQPEYRQDGIRWIKRWVQEGVHGSFVRTARARYKTCMKFLSPLLEAPLPKTNDGLRAYFNEANKYLLLHSCTTAISIDAFDDYFTDVVADTLKKQGHGKVREDKKAWSALLQPAYRSVGMEYKLAVLELAQSSRRTSAKAKLFSGQSLALNVEDIWRKYFWLTMGWSGTAPLTLRDITQEVQAQIKLSPRAYREERAKLMNYPRQIAQARTKLIKQFHIPVSATAPYLKILDAFARLHDERKEIQMRTLYAIDEVRRSIAQRFKVAMEDVQMLKVSEVQALLKGGKFPSARVQKRKIGYYRLYKSGCTVREVEGKVAWALIDRELTVPVGARQEIKGTIASRGRAIGRAVVTDDPKEAVRLVKRGNILITSMTTPDFVPAMKKAGAVVTNEGGITVHAAIISREFGIPCITGTIHATHMFRTGDRVEVDAEKGIVRRV